MSTRGAWSRPQPALRQWIDDHRQRALEAYRADPLLVAEHGNQEDSYRTGGYADRQLLELIQNAADALHRGGRPGRVEIRLVGDTLYCANEGEPFTQGGLEAVCHAFLSSKRGEEIGRFGLGFKSVLGVTDRPQVFSRSISFGFDAETARRELSTISPQAKQYPVLRTPVLLDAVAEFALDQVLSELADWAETVVRLPLTSRLERLTKDLKDFPTEFLLFAPALSTLRLVFPGAEGGELTDRAHMCTELSDGVLQLTGLEAEPTSWRVWHRTVRPSDQALAEVGSSIRRDEVRVSYAAPLSDRSAIGAFWAYFPLKDVTSTRGIINAPWRVNDDRTNLLEGQFNLELLDAAADMVVEALPSLTTPNDPARHFDYLPARGREAPNFADLYLTQQIPQLAREVGCIPDADGVLRKPQSLTYPHFELKLEPETHRAWHAGPSRPAASPHWSCFTSPTRRARLRTLVRPDDAKKTRTELGAVAWLQELVPSAGWTDEDCDAALRTFSTVKEPFTRRDMLGAKVIPDDAGGLQRLDAVEKVFLRGDVLTATAGLRLVRSSFLDLPRVEETLRPLGFQDVDPKDELRLLLRSAARTWGDKEWSGLWGLVNEVPLNDARALLAEHVTTGGRLKVRTRAGIWKDVGEVVVAGLVQPVAPTLALDEDFHQVPLSLLEQVGVTRGPVVNKSALQDLTFLEYLRVRRQIYVQGVTGRAPDPNALMFDRTEGLTGLHMLRRFADTDDPTAQALWSRALLDTEQPTRWRLTHQTKPEQFPPYECPAPHIWAVTQYGLLDTDWGARPARGTLARGLSSLAPYLPVAVWPGADKVELVDGLDRLPLDIWREFLNRVPQALDARELGRLVAEAARRLPERELPEHVPAVSGTAGASVPRTTVYLAEHDEEVRALRDRELPCLAVDKDVAEFLAERWGCRLASADLRVEVIADAPRTAVVLLDRYRGLRPVAGGKLDGLELVECSGLVRHVTAPDGIESQPVDLAVDGNTVYHLDTLDDDELLELLAEKFGLSLTTSTLAQIGQDSRSDRVKKTMLDCRLEPDHAAKLLIIGDENLLASKLPTGLLDTVRRLGQDPDAYGIAEMFLHVHGYDAVWELRKELEDADLPVPIKWAGSSPAVDFVRQLGFPSEYAGTRGSSLEADLTISGPPDLKPLHDYQERLAARIRGLMADGGRALLSLPTGAGKTRVTVEAFVRAFTEDGFRGPLLWIAQSEELCEQAVQTWDVVWRQFGDHRPMRVCRLWGRNEVAETEAEVTVVVATDAKLAVCREKDDYAWLSTPSAVVIDEAHGATATDITASLRWLGLDSRNTPRPLLGLTATPFKGRSEEGTRRLAGRFHNVLWNELGDDPYQTLQDMNVLSRVSHRLLIGSDFALDADEAKKTRERGLLPSQVLERIGRDEVRTQRLLDDITSLPRDWPVLVFTASVLSAQVLAALLKAKGIKAAAVSGTSRIHERRRAIEAFRANEIQVLTNCSVLTEGFDAPGVRALYIARPTFSPNAYIQMVGRGLRGEKNGGKEECLVVNVEDTFGQFGESLAYEEFAYLWTQGGGGDLD
jgi:superfamily II DNA or RNA helicase